MNTTHTRTSYAGRRAGREMGREDRRVRPDRPRPVVKIVVRILAALSGYFVHDDLRDQATTPYSGPKVHDDLHDRRHWCSAG